MKVKDLIAELQKIDPEAAVVIPFRCVDWGSEKIDVVYEEPMILMQDGKAVVMAS